jgi:hypothetical protein
VSVDHGGQLLHGFKAPALSKKTEHSAITYAKYVDLQSGVLDSICRCDPGKSLLTTPSMLNAAQIHGLIQGLPAIHVLKNSPQDYVDDFVMTALEVYPQSKMRKVLQDKFLIPDTSNYSDEKYFQSASELSVSRYLKQKEKENLIREAPGAVAGITGVSTNGAGGHGWSFFLTGVGTAVTIGSGPTAAAAQGGKQLGSAVRNAVKEGQALTRGKP